MTLADGSRADMTDVYFNVAQEDVAAAGLKVASIADLLAGDSIDFSGVGSVSGGHAAAPGLDLAALLASGGLEAAPACSAATRDVALHVPEVGLRGYQQDCAAAFA